MNFSCVATGFPTPTLSWKRNGQPFSFMIRLGVTIAQSMLVLPEEEIISERTSTLLISNLVLSDVANYSCLAENTLARPQEQESSIETFSVLCELTIN